MENVTDIINQLKYILSDRGCIASEEDAVKFYEKVKIVKSVSGRTVVLCVLHVTACNGPRSLKDITTNITMKFLNIGGWSLLSEWFSEAITVRYCTLLNQFIETLTVFPINIELLRSSCIPKLLKNAAKLEDKALQIAARKLLISWKKFVRDTNEAAKHVIVQQSPAKSGTSFLDSLSAVINTAPGSGTRKRRANLITPRIDDDDEIPIKTSALLVNSKLDSKSLDYTHNGENGDDRKYMESENIKNEDIQINGDSKKKKVSFREDKLEEVYYFEMTEQECLEMHGEHDPMKFDETRHLQSLDEKQMMLKSKSWVEIVPLKEWLKPIMIEDAVDLRLGADSTEKEVQSIRESDILPPLYVDKSKVPDCPKENDVENAIPNTELLRKRLEASLTPMLSPCIPYWQNYVNSPTQQKTEFYGGARRNYRGGFGSLTQDYPLNQIPQREYPQTRAYQSNQQFPRMPGNQHHPRVFINQHRPRVYANQRPPFRGRGYRARGTGIQPHVERYTPPSPPMYQQLPQMSHAEYDSEKSGKPPDIYTKAICKHFRRGICNNGDACRFRHDGAM